MADGLCKCTLLVYCYGYVTQIQDTIPAGRPVTRVPSIPVLNGKRLAYGRLT